YGCCGSCGTKGHAEEPMEEGRRPEHALRERDMTPDRWRRIEALYHEMLGRPEHERATALRAACAGDAGLQADVQSLLDQPASAVGFLAAPALDVAARFVSPASVLATGRRLGVFEVEAPLGVG